MSIFMFIFFFAFYQKKKEIKSRGLIDLANCACSILVTPWEHMLEVIVMI
jgi:hypothetical protein